MIFNKLIKQMKNERGDATLIMVILSSVIACVLGLAVTNINVAANTGAVGAMTAQQARWYAEARANEINLVPYSNISSVSEIRTNISGTFFDREVIVGSEVVLGGGIRQKQVTINIFKTGEVLARGTLSLISSSANSTNGVPTGAIIIWSGSISDIPSGWTLCNGLNGTPDLRNRFVVGAGVEINSYVPGINGMGVGYYSPGALGGEDTHRLTIAELARHNHIIYHADWSDSNSTQIGGTNRSSAWLTKQSSYTGEDLPHENRPPYYALAYIMKL